MGCLSPSNDQAVLREKAPDVVTLSPALSTLALDASDWVLQWPSASDLGACVAALLSTHRWVQSPESPSDAADSDAHERCSFALRARLALSARRQLCVAGSDRPAKIEGEKDTL
jgi:hypothetical protein